jgi:hypothetical protein
VSDKLFKIVFISEGVQPPSAHIYHVLAKNKEEAGIKVIKIHPFKINVLQIKQENELLDKEEIKRPPIDDLLSESLFETQKRILGLVEQNKKLEEMLEYTVQAILANSGTGDFPRPTTDYAKINAITDWYQSYKSREDKK